MATQTTNYNLTKPARTDYIDVDVINENYDTIDTILYAKQDKISKGTLTLTTSWSGSGPYTQVITISGSTQYSKIDLQPDANVIEAMISDGVTALWVQNDAGVLTAYALGGAPSTALTIQYIRTEVMA